jgi:hypothetical protein
VAVVAAGGRRFVGEVVGVDLDEGVLGSEDVLEAVGDEEEAVGGGEDGLVEGVRIWVGGDKCRIKGRRAGRRRVGSSVLEWGGGDGGGVGRGTVGGVEEMVVVRVAAERPAKGDG